MSRINVNNYEAFWLDYIEGNLSSDDTAEFVLFATQHPELEIDLEESLIELPDTSTLMLSTAEKDKLKEIAELETLVVQEMDEELSSPERLETLKLKYQSKYQELLTDFLRTKLVASPISFEKKQDLKQPVVLSMYVKVAVAASVIGIIATLLPWSSFDEHETIADKNPPNDTESVASIRQINPINSINHKSFNFGDSIEKQLQHESMNETPDDDFIVEETPVKNDSIVYETPAPLNEETNIALDSTKILDDIQDQIVVEKDSIHTTPEMEVDDDVADNSSAKNLTVPEFLAKKVLKVEKQEEEPLIASIIDQKTNWDVDYTAEDSEKKKVTQFKLGKFEFYKSSNK